MLRGALVEPSGKRTVPRILRNVGNPGSDSTLLPFDQSVAEGVPLFPASRSMRSVLLLAAWFLLLGAWSSGTVQRAVPRAAVIEGTVLEPSGVPVVGARVELWSGSRVLVADQTDTEGRFTLETDADWAPGWQIRATRLGFQTIDLSLASGDTSLQIELSPAPLPLPGFEVVGDRDICAAGDDRAARDIWRAASRRHAGGLDTLGVASYTRVRTDTLTGQVTAGSGIEGATPGQRASAPLLRLGWTRRIDREGYAFPVRRTDSRGSYDSWGYPPLEADFSSHFTAELFAELHDFQLEVSDSEGWVVHFCARDQDSPYLDGVLELGPDTLITRAEWRFYTEEPDEGAGGWARFPPASGRASAPPLLPLESVVWKTLPNGEIVRTAQWYEDWVIAEGDSVPFLPVRP